MVRESKNLKDEVDTYRALEQQYEDIQIMIEMGYEENDPSMIPEIQEMLDDGTVAKITEKWMYADMTKLIQK